MTIKCFDAESNNADHREFEVRHTFVAAEMRTATDAGLQDFAKARSNRRLTSWSPSALQFFLVLCEDQDGHERREGRAAVGRSVAADAVEGAEHNRRQHTADLCWL